MPSLNIFFDKVFHVLIFQKSKTTVLCTKLKFMTIIIIMVAPLLWLNKKNYVIIYCPIPLQNCTLKAEKNNRPVYWASFTAKEEINCTKKNGHQSIHRWCEREREKAKKSSKLNQFTEVSFCGLLWILLICCFAWLFLLPSLLYIFFCTRHSYVFQTPISIQRIGFVWMRANFIVNVSNNLITKPRSKVYFLSLL